MNYNIYVVPVKKKKNKTCEKIVYVILYYITESNNNIKIHKLNDKIWAIIINVPRIDKKKKKNK